MNFNILLVSLNSKNYIESECSESNSTMDQPNLRVRSVAKL